MNVTKFYQKLRIKKIELLTKQKAQTQQLKKYLL